MFGGTFPYCSYHTGVKFVQGRQWSKDYLGLFHYWLNCSCTTCVPNIPINSILDYSLASCWIEI
jgi:hypothetical protein